MSNPKKKPSPVSGETSRAAVMRGGRRKPLAGPALEESRASSSLDGETQACSACGWMPQLEVHTCSKRPMTAEERAVVDEIVRACEVDASRHTPYVQALAAKIRAARKEGE